MTVATVASRALAGIDAPEVTVEVHLGPGLPASCEHATATMTIAAMTAIDPRNDI